MTAKNILDRKNESAKILKTKNVEDSIMQEQQFKFYEFIKSNSWISVIAVLRSNRNFGLGSDMV